MQFFPQYTFPGSFSKILPVVCSLCSWHQTCQVIDVSKSQLNHILSDIFLLREQDWISINWLIQSEVFIIVMKISQCTVSQSCPESAAAPSCFCVLGPLSSLLCRAAPLPRPLQLAPLSHVACSWYRMQTVHRVEGALQQSFGCLISQNFA